MLAARKFYGSKLQKLELALLQRCRRPYVITYQGTDARQRDYCRAHFEISQHHEPESTVVPGADDQIRWQIEVLTRRAAKIYALNPDLMHVLPKGSEFLPYASVDLREWIPSWEPGERPLIVHAPTRRWIKGTHYILDAVERLRQAGHDFDFEIIEGLTHAQAHERYRRAHLLVDQLLVGWYGGLAVELMALAKPVVCYIRESDLRYIPESMRRDLPIIDAAPGSVYEVLDQWLRRPLEDWYRHGQRSRNFVEAWHDPLKIARRVAADYEAALSNVRPDRSWALDEVGARP